MSTPLRVEVHPGCEAVVDFDPDLTFECVESCTWCCHRGVPLYEDEAAGAPPAARAAVERATRNVGGRDVVGREDKDREEHVDVDGRACRFLDDDGRCALHAEYDWKPARCSVFPLSVTVEDGEIHVDVHDAARTYCEGLGVSDRRVVDDLAAFLPRPLWEVDDPTSETVPR
ncbi:hypothetical protein [Halomarina ordinaria]|uniref:YkgJ family cysteine cluster protein n=1 Tax=Halomarina ordinaria TaxID=3033939 RepID=A0ABD5U3P6_9EURY|nr:hypothetical protein [Halomarina sp. PSRA2]